MSSRDWQWPLEAGEILCWQGRPAPRCYTFRNWKLATAGTLLFFGSSFWLLLAYQLIVADGSPWWLLLIPAPLAVLSFWYGPLSLLLARIRWEQEFYALTDRRLLVRRGLFSVRQESFVLRDLVGWKQKSYSQQLIGLRLSFRDRQPVVLHCLEQPQNLLAHLQCYQNNPLPAVAGDSV